MPSKKWVPSRPEKNRVGKIGLMLLFFSSMILAILSFYGWEILQTGKRIQFENPDGQRSGASLASLFPGETRISLKGEEDGRINILLLGRAGEKYPGRDLTDTVMMASIDTNGHRIGFLSLPRDLYAPIPGTGLFTKLNSLYQYGLNSGIGIDAIAAAIKEITGQPIHYFIILDFDGFENMIDTLGGISIYSERDILDVRYPGKNYSYETFALGKGWHTLDGKTALKYVRERHDDPQGDFGRAKRQQETIQAIREKAFSLTTLLNPIAIGKLLDTLGDSVKTNITIPEIGSFAQLIQTIDTQNPSRVVVDAWQKKSLLRVDHVQVGDMAAFILVPRTGNWNEIRDLAAHLFEKDDQRKRNEFIEKEQASILILSRPEDAVRTARLKHALTDTNQFETVTTLAFRNFPKRDRGGIINKTSIEKPYSLDELLKLFDLERIGTLPTFLAQPGETRIPEADFVILYGDNMNSAFTVEQTLDQVDPTQSAENGFSDFLEPQTKR